jgi:hypothetical protein
MKYVSRNFICTGHLALLGYCNGLSKWLGWGDTMIAYRILVGKPLGKWSLGKPRKRLDNKIKIELREFDC